MYSLTGVRALWLCGDHGPLHFRAVILIVCSSYSDGMTASSFIVYNITACSVPNKYRWTTLKSMIERSRSRTQSRIFIFAVDLRSVPITGLDIRLVDAVAQGASRFGNLLARPKTYWPPKKLTGPFPKTKLVR